jgi:hypothetical protein
MLIYHEYYQAKSMPNYEHEFVQKSMQLKALKYQIMTIFVLSKPKAKV